MLCVHLGMFDAGNDSVYGRVLAMSLVNRNICFAFFCKRPCISLTMGMERQYFTPWPSVLS